MINTILFFDTETDGLVVDRFPAEHPDQPRIVQIAALLCKSSGEVIASMAQIVAVNPERPIPPQASNVHGITNEVSSQFGVPLDLAINLFGKMYLKADLVVAHNAKFDQKVVEAEAFRVYGKPAPFKKPVFCTMEAASPVVNLPPTDRMKAAGFNKPKPPKLEECVRHFFNEDLAGAHDAMIDVQACARVYWKLKELEGAQ